MTAAAAIVALRHDLQALIVIAQGARHLEFASPVAGCVLHVNVVMSLRLRA